MTSSRFAPSRATGHGAARGDGGASSTCFPPAGGGMERFFYFSITYQSAMNCPDKKR